MHLLDTNVVSELRKVGDDRVDANVVEWVSDNFNRQLYISAVTLMELEIGVLRMERRDAKQGVRLRQWMDQYVKRKFMEHTLPIDNTVALACARIHVPNRRAERDALIAATAIVHGMTVVTRNVFDFESTGVSVFNPWNAV